MNKYVFDEYDPGLVIDVDKVIFYTECVDKAKNV
jgi:hypothetical protein